MAHGHGHGGHEEHGPIEGRNKIIALVIAVIALFLAFSETLGKSAQTSALSYKTEAANLWAFFQAKNIRRTTVLTAVEAMKVEINSFDPAAKEIAAKQIDTWEKIAARYRSEPDVREGTIELADRAKETEKKYETAMAKYHHYEVASAAFQIGIVLASATVITGMIALTYLAGALGLLGIVFMGIGLFVPHAVHLF